MTLKLKLLLFLCVVLTGIYAATPLWLPVVFAWKLPAGWQLEKLDFAYPGLFGIKFNHVLVKGEFPDADVTLAVSEMQLGYSGPAVDVGSISLEVRPWVADNSTATTRTLDDLTLPIIRPGGVLADISVTQLQVTIYQPAGGEAGPAMSPPLLVMNFADLRLMPRPHNSFHLVTRVRPGSFPTANGSFEVEAGPESFRAGIRFPADPDTAPWLAVVLEQPQKSEKTTTRIRAFFNAGLGDRERLDSIVASATGGLLTHVEGKIEMQADFAGQETQAIEQVSLTSDAKIEYLDRTGWTDGFIHSFIPGLQRTFHPGATGSLVLAPGSSLVIQNGASPAATFDGSVDLNLASSAGHFRLRLDDLQAGMTDFLEPETSLANGLITFHWQETAPVTYTAKELVLNADKLSLSATGRLSISPEAIRFEQAADFAAGFTNLQISMQSGHSMRSDQFEMQGRIDFEQPVSTPGAPINLRFNGTVSAHNMLAGLPGDAHSPPLTVNADDVSATLGVVSGKDTLVSTGSGTLMAGRIEPLATSAARIDLTWNDLDLAEMAGSITTKTQGFSTELEGETWTGFDLDLAYDLFSNADTRGSGTLVFDNGPVWPFEFSGNAQTNNWDINLPAATVELAQLRRLLRVAHFELPAAIKLTDGDIELRGTVTAGDSLAATMLIEGHGLGASIQESSASNGGFLLNAALGQSVTANGPVSIEAIALAGGIDIGNVRADMTIENTASFGLKNLSAELFGGQLMLHELRYADKGIQDSRVELTHIDLGRLLAFADIDGLQGSGMLEISLPVSSDPGGIMVKNGTFESTGPGHLAYEKEGVAGSNIGLQALQNFQYQVLSGTVDYHSHGVYRMAIRLEGKNPDLYGGHPVVFNLTVNGSLPALFEALFLTGDFEESILQQLRMKQPE